MLNMAKNGKKYEYEYSLVISHKKRGKILQSTTDIIVEKVHSSRYMYYVYFFIYRNMKESLKTFFT